MQNDRCSHCTELLRLVESRPSTRSLKQILAGAIVSNLWTSPFVSGRIVAACAATSLTLADLVFSASPRRSAFSFTAMIRAHSSGPTPTTSLLLFSLMLRSGLHPDRFSFPFLLRASSRSLSPPSAIHSLALRHGLASNAHVATSLLHAYSSRGHLRSVLMVFDEMPHRSEVTYCAVISCYSRSGHQRLLQDGLSLFARMISSSAGPRPNPHAVISSLSCCASLGSLARGKAVHSLCIRQITCLSVELGTALVNMYAKCGSLNGARKVFGGVQTKDASMWTAMIGGLAMNGCGEEAVCFFKRMVERLRPDSLTFTAVLHACSHAGLVETGMRILNDMKAVYCIEVTVEHYGVVVDMLGRAGRLEEAKQVVVEMPLAPNRVVWGTLLHACHGELGFGVALERRFLELGLQLVEEEEVGSGFVVGLSNVYAGACRWKEVGRVREKMMERGLRKESAVSLLEVDGVVHRFLVGDTSHPLSKEIYMMLHWINKEIMQI